MHARRHTPSDTRVRTTRTRVSARRADRMRLGVQPRRSPLQDVGNEKARTLDLAAMLEPAAALRPGAAVRRVRAQDHGLGTAGLPFLATPHLAVDPT